MPRGKKEPANRKPAARKPAASKRGRTKKSADPALHLPPAANTGAEEIPPGATTGAADRRTNPGGGAPGSGGGPRHASGDPGSVNESLGREERDHAEREATRTEPYGDGPPYAGPSGGAVGGTPAEKRVSGGKIAHGFDPGAGHRPDTTIGARPDEPSD